MGNTVHFMLHGRPVVAAFEFSKLLKSCRNKTYLDRLP